MTHLDWCFSAIESTLRLTDVCGSPLPWDGTGLPVAMAARWRRVIFSVRFDLFATLAAHVGFIKRRIFGAVCRVGHRVSLRARHAVVLRMFLAAASLADDSRRVAALALAGVATACIADAMLPDAHFVF
jgi:hypothetical protein